MIKLLSSIFTITIIFANFKVGDTLTYVDTSSITYLNGSKFTMSVKSGKYIIYQIIDPDVGSINKKPIEILKSNNYPVDKFESYAIINVNATWKPTFLVREYIKFKQDEAKKVKYIIDENSTFIKAWHLKDNDGYSFIFVDPNGKILYFYEGFLNNKELNKLSLIIDRELKN